MSAIVGDWLATVLCRLWWWMIRPVSEQDRAYARLRGCACGLY
jgi:hypothetical protein